MPIQAADEGRTLGERVELAQLCGMAVEQAPEAIYIVHAPTRCVIHANPAFQRMLGYALEEICALAIYDFINDKREHINARFRRALHSKLPIHGDREYRRKDGTVVCVDTSAFTLRCPGPQLVCTISRDVTEHRLIEGQIRWYRDQLRLMTWQLYLVEQRQRRRMAQILHDQAGQLLTAAILRLDAMGAATDSAEKAAPELQQISQLLHNLSQELRSLTLELSPPVLHEHGLCKAVEWLAESFAAQHQIPVRVEVERNVRNPSEDISMVMFQSLRELLTNVVKHAHASSVEVKLDISSRTVEMVVRDDGIGFNPTAQFLPRVKALGGFGLFSIGQRLSYLGGGLEITSNPGAGTQIILHLPLEPQG